MGVSKSFGTHITEEPPTHLFSHCFLAGHWIKWAKFGRFWANNSFLGGDEVKLLVPSNQGTNETPLSCAMCNFDLKIWIFGAKSHFFCFGIKSFVNRAYHQYTRGCNFPIGTTPMHLRVLAIICSTVFTLPMNCIHCIPTIHVFSKVKPASKPKNRKTEYSRVHRFPALVTLLLCLVFDLHRLN